ncbi:cyclase family protein [Limnospira platensis CENA597]|uniref:cyclase family protein n=1 Tax=Limnospira platensis TaxID=118562 RepID=UPI003DA026C5
MNLAAGDEANVSQLDTDVHVGTHVDAPCHFIESGTAVEDLSLDVLMGVAYVAELPEVQAVTALDLEKLNLPPKTTRLLLYTTNSQLWQDNVTEFNKDFVALTADGAQWLVDKGIRLIGVDYLSVQRYHDSTLTHEILLKAGIIIVEGLNLTNVAAGMYQLVCLPIKLVGSDGSPARAVLIKE